MVLNSVELSLCYPLIVFTMGNEKKLFNSSLGSPVENKSGSDKTMTAYFAFCRIQYWMITFKVYSGVVQWMNIDRTCTVDYIAILTLSYKYVS